MDADQLLSELDSLRLKFTESDDDHMRSIIAELIRLGVYPGTTPLMLKSNIHHLQMVKSYGVRWHIYDGMPNCPFCGVDLRDQVNGPPFKREIAIIHNDRCIGFKCPECKKLWGRDV